MREILKKIALICMCIMCSLTVFVGCGETPPPDNSGDPPPTQTPGPGTTPPPVESTTYKLIFDEDNNSATTNVEKTINKTDINNRSTWPTLAHKNGFAGEWVKKSQNGDNITLIPNYGDGTEEDPYLVANMTQFKSILASSVNYKQIYTEGNYYEYTTPDSIDAYGVRRIDQYDTCEIVYYWTGKDTSTSSSIKPSWVDAMEAPTNRMCYRLVADLDFGALNDETATVGGKISLELDGGIYDLDGNLIGSHALNNLDETKCKYTSGSMANAAATSYNGALFHTLVSSTIKNIELNQKSKIVTIATQIKGETTYENIVINAVNDTQIEYATGNNNESPFVNYVMRGADFTMKNCVSNIDINSETGYFGIFVGGYAQYGSTVRFKGCVNNGDVITSGHVGMFFGSNNTTPSAYSIVDCVNNGVIMGNANSHILASKVNNETGKGFNGFYKDADAEARTVAYDETVPGRFTQNGSLIRYTSTSVASVIGNDLVITNSEGNLTAGTYEITIHRSMWKVDRTGTRRFYIPIATGEVDGTTNTITIEDVFYNVIDANSFVEDGNTIPLDAEWHEFDSDGVYTWAKDDVSKSYILDLGDDYELYDTDRMIITIVVKDAQGNIIESLELRGLLPNA